MRVFSFDVDGLIEASTLFLLALCLPMAPIAPRFATVACAGLLAIAGYVGFDLGTLVFSVVATIGVFAAQGLFWRAALVAGSLLTSGFYSAGQGKFDYDVPSLVLSSLLVFGAFVAGFLIYQYQMRWRGERERARMRKFELASQFHDTVASDLTALIVKLEGMVIAVPEYADDLRTCAQSARRAMCSTRQLLENLTTRQDLAEVKLIKLENIFPAMIARLAEQGFNVKSRIEAASLEVPVSTVEVLSQCLNETVANVVKYADLDSAVELSVCVESRSMLVSVTNTPAVVPRCGYSEGRGLENIAAALARVSGHLQIKQSPGRWKSTLSIPLF